MEGAQRVDQGDPGPIVDPQPGRFEVWFHRAWLWLWSPLLVAAAIMIGVVAESLVPHACWSSPAPAGCAFLERMELWLFILVAFISIAAGIGFLLLFARLLGLWRSRRRGRAMEPRVQTFKEWFLRGDLDEGEYVALESAARSHADASAPGPRRATAAWALLIVGVPLCMVATGFLIAFVGSAVSGYDQGDDLPVIGTFVVGLGAPAVLATTLGVRLAGQSRVLRLRAKRSMDEAELEVLKRARGRRTGTRVAVVAGGPSFQSWR